MRQNAKLISSADADIGNSHNLLPLTLISTLLINESVDLYQTAAHWNINSGFQTLSDKLSQTPLAPIIEKAQTEWASYAGDAAKTFSLFFIQ